MGRWWSERWPYERHDHRMTLAERDGELVGFTYLGPDDLGDPGVGLLDAIHLAPEHVGTGAGRALMIDALAAMYELGRRRAALWVYAENRHARDFYRRGGWRPDGTERTEDLAGCPARQLRYTRPLP